MRTLTSHEISWEAVSRFISNELFRILGKEIKCKAKMDDYDYWAVNFLRYKMPIDEIEKICCHLDANDVERSDAFPTEKEDHVKSFGVAIANKLLSSAIRCFWRNMLATKDKLYLIDCEERESLVIGHERVFFDLLKSKQELIDYLSENGPNEPSLAEFCYEYGERHKNSLYWHYPIGDEMYLGAYIVLVKEGILCLPYKDADEKNYESFCLEETRFLTGDDIFLMKTEFCRYADGMSKTLETLTKYIAEKEREDDYD